MDLQYISSVMGGWMEEMDGSKPVVDGRDYG